MQIANVSAARRAAPRIPTMSGGFPAERSRKRISSALRGAAVGLTGVLVQRRGQHRPAVLSREALRRLGERPEPAAAGLAGRAAMIRKVIAFDSFRVPATFAENFVHAVTPLNPFTPETGPSPLFFYPEPRA